MASLEAGPMDTFFGTQGSHRVQHPIGLLASKLSVVKPPLRGHPVEQAWRE